MYKGVLLVLANIMVCASLIIAYALNAGLGQVFSMVVAGSVIGSFYAILAWLVNHSQLNYLEKRNLLIPLYVTLSVAIFWLAASLGDGSIFKIHELENRDLFSLMFIGGIFGLLMGFGVLFDNALLNRTSTAKLLLFVSLTGFALMIAWYGASDGMLFVVSVIITRIVLSVFMNRVYADKMEGRARTLGVFVLSLTIIVLPWAAFLTK